jgi:hypothetical protein
VTIRRFLVVGVCTVGVVGLYLAPSVARSPGLAGSGVSGDRPISRPSTTAKPAAAQSAGVAIPDAGTETSPTPEPADRTDEPAEAKTDEPADSSDESADSAGEPTSRSQAESKSQPQPQPSRSGATAFDPKEGDRDDTPPGPVGGIRFGRVTPTELTVRWAPANDDTGVVGYRLWLDGFVVATTVDTEVTVKWFNDDMGQHVIQLKALDAAGNQSETAQSVLVSRPTPEPTPEPSAEPTDSESEPPTDADKGKPEGKASEPANNSSASKGDG